MSTPAGSADLEAKKRQLLALLMKEEGIDPLRSPIVAQRRDRESYPLSFEQERLWVIDQIEPDNTAYNLPGGLHLIGPLRRDVLERAFTEVVRRHFVLRTIYAAGPDGVPVQTVQPPFEVRIPVVDLTALSPEDRGREHYRISFDEGSLPFDLARGPIVRFCLLHIARYGPAGPAGNTRMGPEEHILLTTVHHIASDGWSNGVLMRELIELYPAFLEGRPSPLPELPVQYVDFAVWQRQALRGPALEKSLAYWRRQLAGSPVLELPGDRLRPAVQGTGGAVAGGKLPRDVVPGLRELARAEGATLFMLTAAAYCLLLSRYSGQEDLTVGTPVANRPRTELERLIGFFVNTVVLRADLAGDPTFRELLGRVKKTVLESFAHQQLPFSKVVEAVNPERSLAHTPLFQVMVGLGNASTYGIETWDPEAEPEPAAWTPPPGPPMLEFQTLGGERDTVMFDLNLSMVDSGWAIQTTLEYRTDLFDPPTAARLLGHYGELLRGAVAGPDRRISGLPLLTEAERAQVRTEWNDTQRDRAGDRDRTLHGLIAEQAGRTPDAVACEHRGVSLTYRELLDRARTLAARLRALGVGPEARVGVRLPRTLDLPVTLLAVLESGGAYVPLDPTYPEERLRFLVEDSGAAVVIDESFLKSDSSDAALVAREFIPGRPAAPSPTGGLAYLIYTSGSTGRPKGVAIEHRSAVALARWAAETFSRDDLAAVLASTSVNFDLSVFELFVPLTVGGRVILVDDALALAEAPVPGLTLINTVPSAMTELVRAGALPATVRAVCLAGEPLPQRLVDGIHALLPEATVWNLYGPSEDTTYSTFARVPAGTEAAPSIGRPVAGSRVYLFDRFERGAQLVPVGVPGELFLAGDGLARGYLDRPDLTAERFVPDPCGERGERLYRTGDLARWRTSGELDFLGRIDHQVKVRGFRIELGEIEAVLGSHPGVRECAVLALDRGSGKTLTAYVVPVDGTRPSDLRDWLRGRLPEHMVPAGWVPLESLPLTPNGKIDRRALASRGRPAAAASTAVAFVEPRTPAEEVVAETWSAVLGLDRPIGIHDNFFDLGGHSLLATRVVTRLREAFRVDLPIRVLFEAPTVAELTRRVEAAGARAAGFELADLEPRRAGQTRFPLSFSQERLWLIDQIDPGSPAYNLPTALRMAGAVDPGVLARCLTEIARRHEVLRTTYGTDRGAPVQIVHPPAPVPVPVIDLAALPEERREAEARGLADAEAAAPFDLAQGPVLRARLLRLGPESEALLFTMHHIASDGWSMGVLVGEVTALYGAFAAGQPSPLPELPLQYADYARWQRRAYGAEALAASLAYWRRQLDGAPVLELPADRPRPSIQGAAGGAVPVRIPAGPAAALRALARQEGATLFMALTAAFQLLLARYSRQTDLTVGTPVAGRHRTELEPLIGFFVNTLVLRTDLGGDPPFPVLLRRVREVALEAFAHQELPFEKLVEEINPERSLAFSPLFQVMVALQNAANAAAGTAAGAGPGDGGLPLEPFAIDLQITKFDLTLSVSEVGEELAGTLEYRAELFDRATVERLLGHFGTLLEGLAADPGRPLSELPLLPAAERLQVLKWSAGPPPSADRRFAHERFAAQAAATPDAPAILQGETRTTYHELAALVEPLARALAARGVGPEVRVGVCVERSPLRIAAVLAVLQAGGAYVPFDPTYPRERLTFMAEDAGITLLLATPATAEVFPPLPGVAVLDLIEVLAVPAVLPAPSPGLTLENTAYFIYTSGSTGRPKGVQVSHRSFVNLIEDLESVLALGPGARLLQFASLAFDASVFEIFPALASGACLVLPEEEPSPTGADLADLLRRQGVTTLHFPPSVLASMGNAFESLPALTNLAIGGEKVAADLARTWARGRRFLNVYGPTETTVICSAWEGPGSRDGAPPPIGRPLRGTQMRVLDPAGQLAPAGVPGEVCIGGAALTRGYLNRPDLTAASFVPDPYAAEPGARLYRSGDLARWLPDGNLDIFGRIDGQVKVRGLRVETGEIEALLRQHPAVADAAVVLEPGGLRLLAFYVARPGSDPGDPAPGELRAHLRASLPEALIPSFFTRLDALPLTSNRKLDRRALLRLAPAEAPVGDDTPRTPAEERLAEIFAEVLRLGRVGIHSNFFELGGHSLLATQVISRVRDAFRVEVPQRTLFEAPTVAGLAEQLAALQGEETGGEEVQPAEATPPGRRTPAPPAIPVPRAPLPRGDWTGDLPLSFAQQRLWFLDRLEPGSPLYNVFVPVPVADADPGLLAASLNEIARRHEALRTTFAERDGEPVQVIHPPGERPIELPVIDLDALPAAARAAEAARLAFEEAVRPFDLARGPLLRLRLVRAGGDGYLLVAMHHIISDGWSLGVLREEMTALYTAFATGQPSPLPPLPVQYADFALWQRRYLSGPRLEAEIAHWRQQLAGIPAVLELPLDRPRPPVRTFRGAQVPVRIPAPLMRGLNALSQRTRATAFMTLLAAYEALLGRFSGKDDLTVGTPIANRNRVEIERLIGFFVNTLVLRGDLTKDPTFAELIGRVRRASLQAFSHQDLPFEKLVEALEPERSLSHSALFQVMFSLQAANWLAEYNLADPAAGVAGPDGLAKFDLTLTLLEDPGGIGGSLNYNTDLFDEVTALRLSEAFVRLLGGAVEKPDRRLSELPVLSAGEAHQLRVEWNDTARIHPEAGLCLHEVFRRQGRGPEEPAVAFEETVLTFGELDRRSNRLAHHLARLGVGPEVRVGLLSNRRPEMVVGLLGILKAGGIYVPLDPGAPRDRLEMLLDDTAAPVVLTRAELAGLLPQGDQLERTVLRLDADWDRIQGDEGAPPHTGVTPGNGAYIIYTSGSTGRPKGVVIEHRQALHYLWGIEERIGLERGASYAMVQPLTVDSCKTVIFPCLLRGGYLHLIEEGKALDPRGLADYFAHHRIDLLKIAPSHLSALQSGARTEELMPRRWLVFGGEASRLEWALDLQKRGSGCRVFNHYGPTETTVGMLTGEVLPGLATGPSLTTPLGRPLADVQIYNLDAAGNPVPQGVPGELWIGGAYVARGYLGRPDLTAERFLPDPFGGEPGTRLYRTGDLVRLLRDGRIEFLGRIDHQVKIRGFRIELGEIDAALARHPGVAEGLTAAQPDASGALRLVAYIVPRDTMPPAGDLHAFLSERLPEYMVPAAFVEIAELPRTSHGKVDRKLLPAADLSAGTTAAAPVEPRTAAETALAEIWSELLGLDRVGVRDDFFTLGGHSLLAVRLMSRIRARFGRDLPISALFQRPTIERLAEALETGAPRETRSPLVPIQPAGEGAPLFFIHPVGGNVLGYADLARHLGSGRPFYGLQSPDPEAIPATLEALATLYLSEARKAHPRGPWRLGGWSMGALIAWEMARQLQAGGEPIGLLALVDPSPADLIRPGQTEAELALSFARDLAGLGGLALPAAEAALKDTPDEEVLSRLYEGVRQAGLVPGDVTFADIRSLFETFKANTRLLAAYRPGRVNGDAKLITATASADFGAAPSWERLLDGKLEVRVLEGDHYSILREPDVGLLAPFLHLAG